MAQSQLRILFVLPYFVVGGVEHVALTLAHGLKEKGHTVTFCILHRNNFQMLAEAESAGFRILNWIELPIELKIARLQQEANEHDILHAHLPYVDGVVGTVLEKRLRTRNVVTVHLPNINLAKYRQLDAVVACCDYAHQTMTAPAGVKVLSILNGSDVPLHATRPSKEKARTKLSLPRRRPVLGRISRLDEEKFSISAYEAWKKLLADIPNAIGILVGDGNFRPELLKLIRRDKFEDRLILPGSTRDRMTWLTSFDAFVYSTDADACPLVLIEAMGAGLPIVAPHYCGIPELIRHQETGLLYPHNNWDEMTTCVKRIVAAPAFARKLGREARKVYLACLSGEAMCDRYVALYSDMLNGGSRERERLPEIETKAQVSCRVQIGNVGFGYLGLRGDLGFSGKLPTEAAAHLKGVIGAHAPSRVVIRVAVGGTIRIRAVYDLTAQMAKSVSHAEIRDLDGVVLHDLGFFTPTKPMESVELNVTEHQFLILILNCSSVYSAHTFWMLENADIESDDPKTALGNLRTELLSRARTVTPGDETSHELFVQTHASRFEMALRSVATHLICACRKPKRVLILSFDDLAPIKPLLPDWCEYLSGAECISKELEKRGLSAAAIAKILYENMFAKYAVPRLMMGSRVLVSDDDVIWCGPAREMLECKETYFFLEDLSGFYGKASLELFRSKGVVDSEAMKPPFLCAGLYLLNSGPIRDAKIISQIIECAESARDEQSAVGMETRMPGVNYRIGRYPTYHHGAYGPQLTSEQFDVMHMQGWLMAFRDNDDFQLRYLAWALQSHAAQNHRTGTEVCPQRYGVFIPLHPMQANLLELNLRRAQECGALNASAIVVVVEDEADIAARTTRVKTICEHFGVTHRYSDEKIGVYSLQQSRQIVRYLLATVESMPEIAWAIRCDVDTLLEGDAWRYLAECGNLLGLDICADVRPDFRFDRRGFMIIPCSAFSCRAAQALGRLVADCQAWETVSSALEGVDDLDISLMARLLGLSIGSPDSGAFGYRTLKDIVNQNDFFQARIAMTGRPRIFHFPGKTVAEKLANMQCVFAEISTPKDADGKACIRAWDRIDYKLIRTQTPARDVDISVLVCCRNFLKRFKVFAQSILEQDWPLPRIEVIVSNPDSPDGLGEYIRQLAMECARRFGAQVFYDVRIEAKHGRNRGFMIQRAFEHSQGRAVVGMDCDLVLAPNFLREVYIQTQQNPNTVVGVYRNFLSAGTTERVLSGEINPVQAFAQLVQEDNSENQGYRGVLGYCQSAIRGVWELAGYPTEFDEIAKSDVTFLERVARLGVKPLFLPQLRVLHLHHPRNWMGTEERL